MTEGLERQIIDLVAIDRIYVPMSSFDGKLKSKRPKVGYSISEDEVFKEAGLNFQGERAYARVEKKNKLKARDVNAGMAEFAEKFPDYGAKLDKMITRQRKKRETHLYFGMNEGRRLTQEDYMNVMQDLGLSSERSEQLYPVVMEISRNLTRKRDEDRSVLIGK